MSNVKYDTAERLSSKHQALLMFTCFCGIFCVAWFILLNIELQDMEFKSSAITAALKHVYVLRVFNPGFPESETCFFGYFLKPETRFFSTTKPGYLKKIGIDIAGKY